MTREEAITVAKDIFVIGPNLCQDRLVDMFVALGMLTLDEPKSASNKFADILAGFFPGPEVDEVWRAMDEAGIKIVEK